MIATVKWQRNNNERKDDFFFIIHGARHEDIDRQVDLNQKNSSRFSHARPAVQFDSWTSREYQSMERR